MVDKQMDAGGKSVTVNIDATNGTLVVGDSNHVTTYNQSQIETGTTLSPKQAVELDRLARDIAKARSSEVTLVWQKSCQAIDVADSRFITAEIFPKAEALLSAWKERTVRDAVNGQFTHSHIAYHHLTIGPRVHCPECRRGPLPTRWTLAPHRDADQFPAIGRHSSLAFCRP